MNLGERIKKVRKALELTQESFCNRIGLKRNSISLVESGKRNISDQAILSICREFNVNEEWLRNGTGEMFKAAPSDVLDQLAYKYHLSEADYVMVEKFVNMRPEARQAIFHYLQEVSSVFADNNVNSYAPAYGKEPPQPMDKIINNDIQQYSETQDQKNDDDFWESCTVEQAEAAYIKSRSKTAKKTEHYVLNSTDNTANSKDDAEKAANQ